MSRTIMFIWARFSDSAMMVRMRPATSEMRSLPALETSFRRSASEAFRSRTLAMDRMSATISWIAAEDCSRLDD